MSLNGLDAPKIAEAYQSALSEAGGWLLLHYTSRDTVDLHAQGSGGHLELRDAIAKYPDKSPLYGFLLYRRRKVVLKYVPDGTSRLLIARTSVHYQSLCDHFSPHDTTFSAASADDISDSFLSASCTLHTAASFSSISGASRRQHMTGISEDVEEAQSSNPAVSGILARLREDKRRSPLSVPVLPHEVQPEATDRVESLPADVKPMTEKEDAPILHDGSDKEEDSGLDKEESSGQNLTPFAPSRTSDAPDRDDVYTPRPQTSESSRPTFSSWKPKIRLFTRAVSTASTEKEGFDRSTLPAGMRIRKEQEEAEKRLEAARQQQRDVAKSPKSPKQRRSTKGSRPQTLGHSTSKLISPSEEGVKRSGSRSPPRKNHISAPSVAATEPDLSTLQPPSVPTTPSPARPDQASSIPVDGRTVMAKTSVSSFNKPAVTPERQRLMKALHLRKKQQEAAAVAAAAGPSATKEEEQETNAPKSSSEETQISGSHSIKADSGVEVGDPAQPKEGPPKVSDLLAKETAQVAPPAPTVEQIAEPQAASPTTQQPAAETVGPGAATAEAPTTATRVSDPTSPAAVTTQAALTDSTLLDRERPTEASDQLLSADSQQLSHSATRTSKRRLVPKPLDVSPGAEFDDSFMDELQNATLEQAIPVSIPSTPMSASMSDARQPPEEGAPLDRQAIINSAISQHGRNTSKESQRSILAERSGNQNIPRLQTQSLVDMQKQAANKKNNVSSGISRRIQALEERSQKSGSPISLRSPASLELPPSFLQPPSQGRNMSMTSRPSSRASSRLGSSRTFQPMEAIHDASTPPKTPIERPQKVSITARITRAARRGSPERQNVTEFQQSQVTLDLPPSQDANTQSFRRVERPTSVMSRPESRGSMATMRPSTETGFRFMSRRRPSESQSGTSQEKSPSVGSLESVQEHVEEKKQGLTSRFLKRMSNLSTSSRRSGKSEKSSTNDLGAIDSRSIATARARPNAQSSYIVGDLNIQFPDTLFWKRRWVEVDNSGNLVLTPSQHNETRAQPKKYHLSAFTAPVIPSPEREELPHSVVLDFNNGGTLQLASEDRMSQGQAYRRLSDAYSSWVA